MQFGKLQYKKFGTKFGAYSIVTEREYFDSQITLTDYEAELIISFFGRSQIHIGNVGSNRTLSSKTFRHHPSGISIQLNIVFPKPEKTELRLYLSVQAGFKPNGGDVWFMFIKNEELWIGSQEENLWRSDISEFRKDDFEEPYQSAVNDTSAIRIARLQERDVYARSRSIALQRIEMSGFKCEYDNDHSLFNSRYSKRPYIEVHHLIPISLQCEFTSPLDTIHNIYCLCPSCHRAVHHAEIDFAREILSTLAQQRDTLDLFALSTNDLFGLYSLEDIK